MGRHSKKKESYRKKAALMQEKITRVEASVVTPTQSPQPQQQQLTVTTPPSTSGITQVSSAKKRKKLLSGESEHDMDSQTETRKKNSKVMVEKTDLRCMSEKILCKICGGDVLHCCNGVALESHVTLKCERCDENMLECNPKFEDEKKGFRKLEMKLIYETMNMGVGFRGMKRICSILDMGDVSNRLYYKHKAFITKKAIAKTKEYSKEKLMM